MGCNLCLCGKGLTFGLTYGLTFGLNAKAKHKGKIRHRVIGIQIKSRCVINEENGYSAQTKRALKPKGLFLRKLRTEDSENPRPLVDIIESFGKPEIVAQHIILKIIRIKTSAITTEPTKEGNKVYILLINSTINFFVEENMENGKNQRNPQDDHTAQGNAKRSRSDDSLSDADSDAIRNMVPLTEEEEKEFDLTILRLGNGLTRSNSTSRISIPSQMDQSNEQNVPAAGQDDNGHFQNQNNFFMQEIQEKFDKLENENRRLARMLEEQRSFNITRSLDTLIPLSTQTHSGVIPKVIVSKEREIARQREYLERRESNQQTSKRNMLPYAKPNTSSASNASLQNTSNGSNTQFTSAMRQTTSPSQFRLANYAVDPNIEGTSEMVLIPASYPRDVVTDDVCRRSEKLLNSMSAEMERRGGLNISITGIRHKQGAMIVTCNNRGTVEWLKRIAPLGLQLLAFKPENANLRKAYNLWIPCERTEWDEAISVISRQGIRVDDWHILKKYTPNARPNGAKFLFLGDDELNERARRGPIKVQFRFWKTQAAITQLITVDLFGNNSQGTGLSTYLSAKLNPISLFKITLRRLTWILLKQLKKSHVNLRFSSVTSISMRISETNKWSKRIAASHHKSIKICKPIVCGIFEFSYNVSKLKFDVYFETSKPKGHRTMGPRLKGSKLKSELFEPRKPRRSKTFFFSYWKRHFCHRSLANHSEIKHSYLSRPISQGKSYITLRINKKVHMGAINYLFTQKKETNKSSTKQNTAAFFNHIAELIYSRQPWHVLNKNNKNNFVGLGRRINFENG